MITRVLAGIVVLIAAFAGFTVGAPGASADVTITEVGWWSRNPAAAASTATLDVAAAPDGPSSVSAIGLTGRGTVTKAVLSVPEVGGVQQDGAAVQLCTTPNAWKAGAAQAWDEAPKAECDVFVVKLERNPSTASWSADITTMLSGIDDERRVDLMIVPANTGTVPLGFDVQFGKPELQVEVSEPSRSSSSDDFDSSDFDGADGGSDAFAGNGDGSSGGFPSGSAPFDSAAGTFADTSVPAVPDTADGTVGTSSSAGDVLSSVPGSGDTELAALPTQASVGSETGGGNRTLQAFFFVLVATIVAVGAGVGRWFVRSRSGDGGVFA